VAPQEPFNSPTQILHPSKSTSSLVVAQPNTLTAEDHATLGIKYHEQNLLPQATHHFQLSAEGGSPTGMLFYSLSLRHAWGCAANPAKAVEWLHAAAECASTTVDENGVKRPRVKDLSFKSEDEKRGGAMLALAIYELGQSYINGWGVEKDKYLALRCYEISANFGDTDGQWYPPPPSPELPLTGSSETAWCYLNGIGTKKNPKMAARYYRMAERQGVKNVGLSWIWKEKYDDVDETKTQDEKGRRNTVTDENSSSSGATVHKRRKSIFTRKNTA
jgi:Sel1 repeat